MSSPFMRARTSRSPTVRIYRIPAIPGMHNIRPGFSLKKVVCDVLMLMKSVGLVRRNRYDLVHAVEESAFIAAIIQMFSGVPYIYDMDSSLVEQMVDAHPGLRFVGMVLRRSEAFAVRRSLGVLTVCAALAEIAHGHAPRSWSEGSRTPPSCRWWSTPPSPTAASRRDRRSWSGGDVRRQPRALSGHRPAARRVPYHAAIRARRPVRDRRRTDGRHSAIPRDRLRGGHREQRALHRPPADQRPPAFCSSRPRCWCRPGSRASTRR